MYNLILHDLETLPNKVKWASLLRHLFITLGFYDVWLNQGVGDIGTFLRMTKQRLTDHFIQGWQVRLNESSRANFYTTISSFNFQPYLDCINVLKYSQAFSKLRMSSHRLAIESGRWTRPNRIPIEQRICLICEKVEDECQFVIECILYQDLRKRYIAPYFWKRPSMFKFVNLINTTNKNYLRRLSVFIYQAFKQRTELLYRN